MSDIVIIYARKDTELREKVARCLEGRSKWDVWSDQRIRAGEQFDAAINDEINRTKVVVAIWTPNSVASTWVLSEALMAHDLGKLVPVRVSPPTDKSDVKKFAIPVPFNRIQTADLTGWDGECSSAEFEDLVAGIEDKIKAIKTQPDGGDNGIAFLPEYLTEKPLENSEAPPPWPLVGEDRGLSVLMGFIDLGQAVENVPALRYAFVAAGLATGVMTGLYALGLDTANVVSSIVVVLFFMTGLLVVAKLAGSLQRVTWVRVTCWAYAVAVVVLAVLGARSFLTHWPKHRAYLCKCQTSEEVTEDATRYSTPQPEQPCPVSLRVTQGEILSRSFTANVQVGRLDPGRAWWVGTRRGTGFWPQLEIPLEGESTCGRFTHTFRHPSDAGATESDRVVLIEAEADWHQRFRKHIAGQSLDSPLYFPDDPAGISQRASSRFP